MEKIIVIDPARGASWSCALPITVVAPNPHAPLPPARGNGKPLPRFYRGSRGQARVTGMAVSRLKASGGAFKFVRQAFSENDLVMLLCIICGNDYQEAT